MNRRITRNISLEPHDFDTVRRHAKQWGQSFSSALRLIIREWQQLKSHTGGHRHDDQREPESPASLT